MNPTRKYYFSPSIFGANTDGTLVLLDVKADRYYFLSHEEFIALQPYVSLSLDENRVWISSQITERKSHYDASPLINELLANGILTLCPNTGKVLTKPDVEQPASPFEHIECDDKPRATWLHATIVLLAGLYAHLALKLFPLHFIIAQIRRSKRHSRALDINRALTLGRIYQSLRPLLPRSRICLYDSLAFYCFCISFGLRPNIIFGVTSDPFTAHCWVQAGGYILNDVPQNIKQYIPIMKV